ncbi:calcyphosin-like protein isoform X1 [Haliotis cracherodii]|uniref:calcyphosin-like protein isoform X1 n=1 Tax=Haliotis cracherodii TaxID=6455 RepID=UPI0039EC6878
MAETSTVAEDLLEVIRKECLGVNCGGIKRLGAVFRHLDLDYSKRITFEELRDGLHKFGIHMSQEYLRILFNAFDKDSSGGIDFCEFMNELRPPLSPSRLEVTDEAFHSLDVNGNGYIEIEDLKVVYAANARRHPKYLSGEWTEDETLQNFLDSIDTPGSPDGKVTRDEWINYYSGVSATIEDDCYFDLLMRACYNLPPKGSGKF